MGGRDDGLLAHDFVPHFGLADTSVPRKALLFLISSTTDTMCGVVSLAVPKSDSCPKFRLDH